MKRTALTLAVLGAAIATVIPLTGAGAQSPGPRTIRLVERNKGSISALVDNPPRIRDRRRPAFSLGDMNVFSTPVFDATNRTAVGRLHVDCVATTRGSEERADALCTGVFRLTNGQISVVTVLHGNAGVLSGIVTGGDGAYTGARGTFRSQTTPTGANDTVTLLP